MTSKIVETKNDKKNTGQVNNTVFVFFCICLKFEKRQVELLIGVRLYRLKTMGSEARYPHEPMLRYSRFPNFVLLHHMCRLAVILVYLYFRMNKCVIANCTISTCASLWFFDWQQRKSLAVCYSLYHCSRETSFFDA